MSDVSMKQAKHLSEGLKLSRIYKEENSKMKRISINLPEKLDHAIEQRAEAVGNSKAAVVRQAVAEKYGVEA